MSSPSVFGHQIPSHVVALETSKAGNRYHAFLLISAREKWILEDPEHRTAVSSNGERVLAAWKAFCIVLHADPRAQRALW